MSEGGGKKRKSKSWYRKQAYHNKRQKEDDDSRPSHKLAPGLKGFIVTCNNREKDAVKETYNILNEYADKLYGAENEKANSQVDSDEEDIEKALAKEIQELKDSATTGERRFQNVNTGTKNSIFIKTTLENPTDLAHEIFSDLLKTKTSKSRFALRLLPVVGTCKATVKDIGQLASDVLAPFLTNIENKITCMITFKARNNSGLGRDMTISTVKDVLSKNFPFATLTCDDPEITILIEVMCGIACLAVAKNFIHFRKYNLVEIVNDKQDVKAKNNCMATYKTEKTASEESPETLTGNVASPENSKTENNEVDKKVKNPELINKANETNELASIENEFKIVNSESSSTDIKDCYQIPLIETDSSLEPSENISNQKKDSVTDITDNQTEQTDNEDSVN